jgi:hypothetical protein
MVLIAGVVTFGTALSVIKVYDRTKSIAWQHLWSLGFGSASAEDQISWDQPYRVRLFSTCDIEKC